MQNWSVYSPNIRMNAAPTVWASVMLFEPCLDAVVMEPVCTGQDGNLRAKFYIIHADRAFRIAFGAHHLLINFLSWQRPNGSFSCWWRCSSSISIVLH